MSRRTWPAVAMLAAGVSLLVASGLSVAPATAGKQPLKKGGTLRVNLPGIDVEEIDPSLAYYGGLYGVLWQIHYSTALKLLNYPDAPAPLGSRLVPEGASKFTVSRDGRTYTFTIRPGFRFSNGAPVTAANYAYAINRAADKDLQSPAYQFIADPDGANIVGAQDVRAGKANTVSGVRVKRNKLIIRLTKPDGSLLSKLTMPLFQALPLTLPRSRKVVSVSGNDLPSAGPYYVSAREPNRSVTLSRNPFYRGKRPRNLATVDMKTRVNLDESYRQVRASEADYMLFLPPSAPAELGREFGLNGRFRVRPASCISYIAMNTRSPLFANNPKLRRAVNYAIDRQALVNIVGPYAGLPTDQYLPRGFPGFEDIAAYPFTADLAKARELAEGRIPSGGPWIYFHSYGSISRSRAELVRSQLAQIGIAVELRMFPAFGWWDKGSSRHAFAAGGWCHDYPDPYDFINVLLDGTTVDAENSNNLANFNNPVYNARMARAARLTGAARLHAYARLEHDLVRTAAPLAVWSQPTKHFFFSDRVDMRSFVYQPIYEAPPFNVLALK